MSRTGVDTSGLGDNDQLARNLTYLENGDTGAGEFSWGPGLTPKGLEGAPPCQGGRYRGTTPPCENRIG